MEETVIEICYPEIVRGGLGHAANDSPGYCCWLCPFIFRVRDPVECGEPDASPVVLKKGLDRLSRTVRRQASLGPPIQATLCAEPETSIAGSQNGCNDI